MNDSIFQRPLAAADVVEEVAQNPAAVRRVADLGMELQAEDRPAAMPDRGDRTGVGGGQRHEIAGRRLHLIAVAHPDDRVLRHAGEDRVDFDRLRTVGAAELADCGPA